MDETVIVIMLKNMETGFLETEIGCYKIPENDNLIYNIFAYSEGKNIKTHIKLTVDREIEDWEYSAVFDYYDASALSAVAQDITEDDSGHNPMWNVVIPFNYDNSQMEEVLSLLLSLHKNELDDVFEAIKDLKEEYSTP